VPTPQDDWNRSTGARPEARHSGNYDRWIANLKRILQLAIWSAEGLLDAAADRGRDTKKMEPALSRSSGARRDY
jgi:hypothetical protein